MEYTEKALSLEEMTELTFRSAKLGIWLPRDCGGSNGKVFFYDNSRRNGASNRGLEHVSKKRKLVDASGGKAVMSRGTMDNTGQQARSVMLPQKRI